MSSLHAYPQKAGQLSLVLALVLSAGIIGRIFLASLGYNYDFVSFWIVGEITSNHLNVYAETARYNYGPIWFCILSIFRQVADFFPGLEVVVFRSMLVLFLTLVDIGIFLIVKHKKGWIAGILYFLNPIVMIITGFHNQFDNLAVLIFLLSCEFIDHESRISKKYLVGLLLAGLSLATKHVFAFFPAWLVLKAFDQRDWKKGLLSGSIPVIVFLASFIPSWISGGSDGIVQNVFKYDSFSNAPFFHLFIPKALQQITSPFLWWIIIIIIFGWLFRKQDLFTLASFYLLILVTFSPALTNQYLALPSIFIAIFPNPFFLAFVLVGTFHLFVNLDGLQLPFFQELFNPHYHYLFNICVIMLLAGLSVYLYLFYRKASLKAKNTSRVLK